ncbi:hypothetical protein [Streptomyces sp. NPDC046862]
MSVTTTSASRSPRSAESSLSTTASTGMGLLRFQRIIDERRMR